MGYIEFEMAGNYSTIGIVLMCSHGGSPVAAHLHNAGWRRQWIVTGRILYIPSLTFSVQSNVIDLHFRSKFR